MNLVNPSLDRIGTTSLQEGLDFLKDEPKHSHLLSCVVLNGDKYTLNSLTSAYHYGAYHPARATQSIVSDSVFELPKFSTAEELSNWCTSQFKAGNLVKIVVESC